jgi:hypothetical protein
MNKVTTILAIGFTGALAAAGCSSASSGGTGGSGMTGSGGTTGGSSVDIVPDATGWVDKGMNSLMVQGAWYAYGDGYEGGKPPGKCQMAKHLDSECSSITKPDLSGTGFPQSTPGKMCTEGKVAAVIDMVAPLTGKDYGNIFGNGIGLDLNAPGGTDTTKADWDALGKGVKGISFEIDMVPAPGLRVEFPSKATDSDPMAPGGDYWGATSAYPNSPVVVGVNTILWDMATAKVAGPKGHVFDPHAIESIQFHVPTGSTAANYSFCISNLKMLM